MPPHKTYLAALFVLIAPASSYAKTRASCLAALPVIWAAHYAGEATSTTIHELGHAVTARMLNNSPIDIKIGHTRGGALIFACQPFQGVTHHIAGESRAQTAAIILAGPLAGIAATYAQLVLLELAEQHVRKDKICCKNALKKAVSQPWRFLKHVATPSDIHKLPSLALCTVQGIRFFRCSRLIGESLYGLAPLDDGSGAGDGVKLWQALLGEDQIKTIGNKPLTLICCTAAPYLIAVLVRAVRTVVQEHKRSRA